MTECEIQAILGCHYGVDKGQIVVPNVLLGPYEADFVTITKSDYLIEVEVKISISDFRADFKKKHYHDYPEVNALYYALPKELYEKHREEIEQSCDKVGAGIILINKAHGDVLKSIDQLVRENSLTKNMFHELSREYKGQSFRYEYEAKQKALAENAATKPKADFYDTVVSTESLLSMGDTIRKVA